jgi:hypothetical protein
MDDRILAVVFLLGVFVLSIAAIAIYQRKTKHRRDAEEAELRAQEEEMVRQGVRTPGGDLACMVCGVRATDYMPVSGASWMDKLPLLNRLFSLPPRYVIEDNTRGDLCLCRIHHSVATKKLEEFHAILRAERARFNAGQEERVAAIDSGELMKVVMEQHAGQIKVLRHRDATPMPQLAERTQEEIIDTTVVSSAGASIPPDED